MRLRIPARMRARLDEYEGFHTQRGNELCHWLGIPLIIAGAASILGVVALTRIEGVTLTLTEVVVTGIVVFYLVEARVLGLFTSLALVVLALLGRMLPPLAGLTIFLFGWALQLVGHKVFERRAPAFLGNLVHLLVGPAWLVERLLRPRGARVLGPDSGRLRS